MNTKFQDRIEQLVEDFHNKKIPADDLLYAKELYALPLDYSLDSLEPFNEFLKSLHTKGETPNHLVDSNGGENFLILLAVYLGAIIARQTQKKIEWYIYFEAVEKLPSDYNLPRDFFSSVVGMVEGNVCLPLLIVSAIVNGDNSKTCLSYIEERCQAIDAIKGPNEWCTEYLESFRKKEYIPGGNAYRAALELIEFDDSLRSVEEIDRLLLVIKKNRAA